MAQPQQNQHELEPLVAQEEQQQQIGVDASVAASNSNSSATGAVSFGNATKGVTGTTLAVIVAVVVAAMVGMFFFLTRKGGK